MPEKKIDNTTAAVFGRIVGEAAFMFADPLDPAARPRMDEWEALGVRLSFSGDVSGEFRLWAPPSLARGMAVNMLGLDQETVIARERQEDALKEIVNIIVGNFLTEMYGDAVAATLGLPCLIDPASLAQDYGNPEALWISVEGDAVLCVMKTPPAGGGKPEEKSLK
jgi:CheY-specific phosphatase CheX